MSYTALYRRFRPLQFQDMVGQEHITKTLKNQILADRVGHAYLFNGGRGTGKTTAAKVLARAVNCLNPKDGEPCNECEICKAILSGNLTDVVEMDAASNNGVEDIRAIREEVNFLPSVAKYRVYIIDEVHMLSTGAFNALLKTLEEPPKHVKFILATTEPQKLPATILSRCQRFDFKRISTEDIVKRLQIISNESNIDINQEALRIIAVLSDGGMRDAISILERCIQDEQGSINEDKVRELAGIPKLTYISNLACSIFIKDAQKAINVTDAVIEEGKDLDTFLWETIKYIKDVLVYKTTANLELYNEEEKKRIKEFSEGISKERLFELIYELSELGNNMKWSAQKNIVFQTGIIRVCLGNISLNKQNDSNNVKAEKPIQKAVGENSKKIETNTNLQKQEISEKKVNTVKVQQDSSLGYWSKVLDNLKQSGKMMVYANLIGTRAVQINDMTVGIEFPGKITEFANKILEEHENRALITKLVSMESGNTMQIRYLAQESSKKSTKKGNAIQEMAEELDIPINIIDE